MNLKKAELLAPLICSFGNDLFLKDRHDLGLAHGFPEPLCPWELQSGCSYF